MEQCELEWKGNTKRQRNIEMCRPKRNILALKRTLRFSLVNAKKRGSKKTKENTHSTIHYEILNHLSSALHCTFYFFALSFVLDISPGSHLQGNETIGRYCILTKLKFMEFVVFNLVFQMKTDLFSMFIAQH